MIRRSEPGEIDHVPVDRFTLGHAAAGAAMGLLGAPWWAALGAAIAWEVVETPMKRTRPDLFHTATSDTIQNSMCDAAAWVLAWGIFYRLAGRDRGPEPVVRRR